MARKKVEVGDVITFKSPTRYSNEKAKRKVVGICSLTGYPEVRYAGWGNFLVKPKEIIKVEKPERK